MWQEYLTAQIGTFIEIRVQNFQKVALHIESNATREN